MSNDLKNRISETINNSERELWFPDLTYCLTQNGLKSLHERLKINEAIYCTSRVSLGNAKEERVIAETIFSREPIKGAEKKISVEILPFFICKKYESTGVEFYNKEELQINYEVIKSLHKALEIIAQVPTLFRTVFSLVKSIHIIKPNRDDVDISFSEPNLPFSIFISIPRSHSEFKDLRVAEAIVHEAMHLQLTLIESVLPLVKDKDAKYYSPWKSEVRSVSGVMHSVYVFKVLDAFFSNLNQKVSVIEHKYLVERRSLISEQIAETLGLRQLNSFTPAGEQFVKRLLSTHISRYPI